MNMMQGVNRKTLDAVLTNIMHHHKKTKEGIASLVTRCDRIEEESSNHLQRIGLLRFNPFNDTGGDQSFILSLVDKHDTGVIITALYSRSGTRWFAKSVKDGKGVEHALSEEERKALKRASTQNEA
jgi:hypothetical protein